MSRRPFLRGKPPLGGPPADETAELLLAADAEGIAAVHDPLKTDGTQPRPDDDDAVKLRRKKGCPCADESLCKPLSPQPAARDELLAFPGHPLYDSLYN